MDGGLNDAYDIAIVGGGLVGASLACALEPLSLRCVLIEAVSPKADQQPSYDDRNLALNLASSRILQALGLWPDISAEAEPIREILVSDHRRPGRVHLVAADEGFDAFGYSVAARAFGAAVMRRLPQLPAVDFLCPAKVTAHSVADDGVELSVETGEGTRSLRAGLVVAADGARSTLRQLAGIDARHHDYEQTAVVTNVTPADDPAGRAFEHFTRSGPLAVLPQRQGRCGVVWTVPRDDAPDLLELPDAEFLARLDQRFGRRLGGFTRVGRRSSYPLHLLVASENVAPRLLVIGNAAHAIHPISAQGFNLGLRDVAALAELLHEHLTSAPVDADIGVPELLQTYAERRRADQAGTIRYTDTLARLYGGDTLFHRVLGTAALAAHELLPPLRRQLVLNAMGYRGQVPRMAMGVALNPTAGDSAPTPP